MQLITEFSTVKITEVMVSKKIKFLSHQNMMDLEGNVSVIALFALCFVLTYAEVEQSGGNRVCVRVVARLPQNQCLKKIFTHLGRGWGPAAGDPLVKFF